MRATLHQVVAELLLFVGLTWYVIQSGVPAWETATTRWIHSWPDAAGYILVPVMQLGTRWVGALVAVVVGVRLGIAAGARILASAGLAWAGSELLKLLVERPRINAAELTAPARHVAEGWSYPSTHTAIAFALAVAVGLELQASKRVRMLLFGLALLVGVARMFVGVHLPVDILGGALVGLVAAQLVSLTRPTGTIHQLGSSEIS